MKVTVGQNEYLVSWKREVLPINDELILILKAEGMEPEGIPKNAVVTHCIISKLLGDKQKEVVQTADVVLSYMDVDNADKARYYALDKALREWLPDYIEIYNKYVDESNLNLRKDLHVVHNNNKELIEREYAKKCMSKLNVLDINKANELYEKGFITQPFNYIKHLQKEANENKNIRAAFWEAWRTLKAKPRWVTKQKGTVISLAAETKES